MIKEEIPTITTDFAEIGLYNDEIYFVVIIFSETFNLTFFNKLREFSNITIYGFRDFNQTLYPVPNFDIDVFLSQIKKDKYLQIQFDYKNNDSKSLYKEYLTLISIFRDNDIRVINQLKFMFE